MIKDLKFESPPIQDFKWNKNISQLFGVNHSLYQNFNKAGLHNGIDIIQSDEKQGYGTPILAMHNGIIGKMGYDVPHQTKGNGIYLLSEDGTFSTVYWHLSGFNCNIGQEVKAGEIIGLMGNTGFVRPLPTQEKPYNGTHLHLGVLFHEYNNDYDGFVDPVPFMAKDKDRLPLYFPKDLFIGSSGDYVSWLQSCLALEGLAGDYDPIGYFGLKTLRDVKKLQEKYQIYPQYGYFGLKTRNLITRRWSQFSSITS